MNGYHGGSVMRIIRESAIRWLPLMVVLALGLALRCSHLADRPIWFDEASSWRLISFPWTEMLHRAAIDTHQPFYFVLLKLWGGVFGDGPAALRSLGVICGEGAIVGLYLFVKEADNAARAPASGVGAHRDGGALIAALLMALSTTQIRWSWEMRMYSLAALLLCFSSLFLVRALSGRVRYWYAYAVATALMLYTHPYAPFCAAAQAGFLAGYLLLAEARGDRPALRRVWPHGLFAAALVAALWMPWLPVFLGQAGRVRTEFWTGPLDGQAVNHELAELFLGWRPAMPPFAAGAIVVLCTTVFGSACMRRTWPDGLIVASGVVPFALAIIVSAYWRNVLSARYLLLPQLFFLAAVGRLVSDIPWRPARGAFAGALAIALLAIHHDFCRHMGLGDRPGARGVAEYLRQNRAPSQPVIVDSSFLFLPTRYYVRDCRLLEIDSATPFYVGTPQITTSDFVTIDEMNRLGLRKAWLVTHGDGSFVKPPHWREIHREVFAEPFRGGIQVAEFRVNQDASAMSPP